MDKNKDIVDRFESLQRDLEFTTENYCQMYRRLKTNDRLTRFFVIYYSVISILYGLLPVYFSTFLEWRELLDYLTISFSIIVLIASLLISFANYENRCIKIMAGIDKLKRLKKELKDQHILTQVSGDIKYDLQPKINEYHMTVDAIELRDEIDYYKTCYSLYLKGKYRETWIQLPITSKCMVWLYPAMRVIGHVLLLIFPVVMLFVVFGV